MPILRANAEFAKRILADRVGNEYVYGGNWDPFNLSVGTDCSGLVVDILDAAINGTAMAWTRHGMSTESWRPIEVGQSGTIFGTICVASPTDFPADAAVKIAIHHGPGGGENSHTWCEVDGVRGESNGTDGCVTGSRARSVYDTSYANDWHYLPGPIVGAAAPTAPVTLGVGSTGPEVIALQQSLNTEGAGLDVDGEYGPATAAAFAAFQRRTPYALATIAEGRRRNISPRGIQIGLSVPFVETEWKMYANSTVPESMSLPHDAVGTDHDSVGLWQQRCPMWGPAAVLMDPTLSAGLFFDRLVDVNLGTEQSPIRYDDTSRLPGDFAAEVQRPAAQYRGRYQERMGHAIALYNRLANYQPTAPTSQFEEILMTNPAIPSLSIYANPGEPPVPVLTMIAAQDAHGPHEPYVEKLARKGDADSLMRVARTAAGKGPYGTAAFAVNQATDVLADIEATNPSVLQSFLKGQSA